MKQIIEFLSVYLRAYKALGFWLGWLFFLALSLFLRYAGVFDPDFVGYSYPFWGQLFFYVIPYFFSVCWWYFWYGEGKIFGNAGFWLVSLLILGVLYSNNFSLSYEFYLPAPEEGRFWLKKIGFNLHSIFFYLSAPLLYGFVKNELGSTRFYGCTRRHFDFSPYFWMLILMFPLLFWSSFQPSFWVAYPRYRPDVWEASQGISPWLTVGLYELSYVLQFVALEIFFRGFIVFGLGKYMGKASVFPMVAVYTFLHFYKPLPETLGSIFGGFVLGVVAWKSRSVLGGVIVHIGIALMMELLAFLQLYFRALL